MQSFYELTYEKRFQVYGVLDALQCETHGAGGSGCLAVAVAKGKFSELSHTLKNLGLAFVEMYKFPLGTDTPPAHLRHESYGMPDSAWLIAVFRPY
jgi:hypothetical protein